MNLSQPSGNGSSRVPGVRPLTGPEASSGNEAFYTPGEAPTVKVYPSANQMPALRADRPSLPPARSPSNQQPSGVALSPSVDSTILEGEGAGDTIAFNLRELLEGLSIAKLGFDAQRIPENVAVSLPIALLEPQMASGQVNISLGDVIAGCLEKYRPAFAKADTQQAIQLSIQELQNKLPPKTAMPPQESPFQPAPQVPSTEHPFQLAPEAGASPFAAAQPGAEAASPYQSPFGQPVPAEAAPAPAQASPFGLPVAEEASPFGAPAQESPFAQQVPLAQEAAPAASPFAEAAPASPFGAPAHEQSNGAASPFGVPPQTFAPPAESAPAGAPLEQPAASPFAQAAEPVVEAAPAASPFSAAPEAPATPEQPAASPFGAPPVAEAAPAASPFGAPPVAEAAPAASPFGAPPVAEAPEVPAANESPFSAALQKPAEVAPAASPFGAPPVESNGAAFAPPAAEVPAVASSFAVPRAEAAAPAASPFGAPPADADSTFQSAPAVPANGSASPFGAPVEAAPVPDAAAPAASAIEPAPPAIEPAPPAAAIPAAADSVAAALAAQPASHTPGFEFGFEADPKQLVLRALFGVDTALSAEDVLGRLTNLDGLEACVLIEKQSGSTWATSGKDAARTASFEAQAKQAYQKVISLADDLAVTDAESFTLRTTQVAMSFFNAPAVCLAVLQEGAQFQAGVRERLTLVTRELSEML